MKVTGPGGVKSPSVKKSGKSGGSAGSGFADALGKTSASSGAGPLKPTSPVASVDALLSLQEAPTATDARSKGLARASDMLELLDDVRRGLLLGQIPQSKLSVLAKACRQHRENFDDPLLGTILDEIELRAEVELAKLAK